MQNPESLKIHLPGESLWANILRIEDKRILVAIANDPVSPLHGWEIGDQLFVEKAGAFWMPCAGQNRSLSVAESQARAAKLEKIFKDDEDD